jgi:hypothetical protein
VQGVGWYVGEKERDEEGRRRGEMVGDRWREGCACDGALRARNRSSNNISS